MQNARPVMSLKRWLRGFTLALILPGQALYAQQSNADCRLLADIRGEAEPVDALLQTVSLRGANGCQIRESSARCGKVGADDFGVESGSQWC